MKLGKKLRSVFSRAVPITSVMTPGQPAPQPGRNGLALVAIMRNEARHIEDWIRFHAIAGVRNFYLYDDGSTDDAVCRARAIDGVTVTVVPWQLTTRLEEPRVRFSRQVMAYCHAIENFGDAFRWMGFIDIDEYLVPKQSFTILDVLDGLEDFTNISLPWTMFGPSGHDTPPDVPAPFAYGLRARDRAAPILNFKCIVDPCDVTQVRVHRFRTGQMGRDSSNDVGVTASYKDRDGPGFVSAKALQLNHYYTRSRQELNEKLKKQAVSDASPDSRNPKILQKAKMIEATAVNDRSAVKFLAN